MPIFRMVSFLGGRPFSTSLFSRRSRKGRSTWEWEIDDYDAQNRLALRTSSIEKMGKITPLRTAAYLVQLADHLSLRVLVLNVEPLVKLLSAGEHLRQQEVEQRPQLMQIVLQRRACTVPLHSASGQNASMDNVKSTTTSIEGICEMVVPVMSSL